MTDTSAGWKPALLGIRIGFGYGICLRLYCGFFGAGGGARAARAWRWGAGIAERGAAAVERGGGECGGVRSGNSTRDDEGAGGAVWEGTDLPAVGSAREGRACGFAGRGVERFSARRRHGTRHGCSRSRRTGRVIRRLREYCAGIGAEGGRRLGCVRPLRGVEYLNLG